MHKNVSCSVDLVVRGLSESHLARLVEAARACGRPVEVTYKGPEDCDLSVDFGDDLGGAQWLVSEADGLAERYED
ncbi:hypothetical protein AB0P36_10950 [Streptomyces flavidovirens]|uniref:hypothetical protein n=1 Tax=Streptomyces flavidovirens TaxID=67298 RepID=UPI0034493912